MDARYWALLLGALLHDVPWKPWIVSNKTRWRLRESVKELEPNYRELTGRIEEVGGQELKENDREALALIAWIAQRLEERGAGDTARTLLDTVAENWWSAIHEADMLAASIDRILQPVSGGAVGVLVNMFNPAYVFRAEKDCSGKIGEIVRHMLKELDEIVKIVVESCGGDNAECILSRLYMALYSLLEVAWYKASRSECGEPLPPAADTRIPHHTVFDHLRATALALALRRRTIYAIVDIPGVHGFVGAARKTRDSWAGSWLISLMAWSTVSSIVEEHGPQAVLLPAVHLNPFYLDMLARKVPGIEKLFPRLAWSEMGGWPSQPVIPATISLVLDAELVDCERLRRSVEEGLRGAWERLWSEVRDAVEEVRRRLRENGIVGVCGWLGGAAGRPPESITEVLERLVCIHALYSTEGDERQAVELAEAILGYIEEALREPPFQARVTCVKVDFSPGGEYARFVEDIERIVKNTVVRVDGREWELGRLIEDIVRRAAERGKRRPPSLHTILSRTLRYLYLRYKLDVETRESPNTAQSYTLRLYKGVHRLWEASSRARHPTRAYRYCSVCGRLPAAIRMPRLGSEIRLRDARYTVEYGWLRGTGFVIDEGEALCPYCLLKRLLARRPSIVARADLVTVGGSKRIYSTLRVANAWLPRSEYEKLREFLREAGLVEREEESLVDEHLDTLIDALRAAGVEPPVRLYNRLAVVYGDGDSLGSGYLTGVLLSIDSTIAEENGKIVLRRVEWGGEAVEILSEEFRGILGSYRGFVVRGPGDCSLEHEAIPPLIYYHLLFSAAGAKGYSDVVVALAALTGIVSCRFRREGLLGAKSWPLTLIPTPSYLRVFSTGVMVSSLVDSLLVEALKGVLVYAGGDDILAFTPLYIPESSTRGVLESLAKGLARAYTGSKNPDSRAVEAYERLLRSIVGVEEGEAASGAWMATLLTRLNYWGLLGPKPGFHVYDGVVAQAPAAHGRSYGVNVVHQRTPLWTAVEQASQLMEEKDELRVLPLAAARAKPLYRGVAKDAAIVGYEGESPAAVPFETRSLHRRLEQRLQPQDMREVFTAAALLARAYALVSARVYSRSLIYDVLASTELLKRLAASVVEGRARLEHLEKLAEHIFERNRVTEGERLDAKKATSAVVALGEGIEPLVTQLFTALKHLHPRG